MKTIIPLLAVLFFSACGNNAGKETTSSENEKTATNSTAVQLKDDRLNAVYQHYIHLTTALINGDAAEAKIAGNAIETGLADVAAATSVRNAAHTIVSAKDIEAQRAAYSAMSNDFIALVKQSGLKSGELHVDFCPMALNDKGAYWLSSDKEIRNPYFGEQMMTCGEVKETLTSR